MEDASIVIPEKNIWGQIKGTRRAHQAITQDPIKGD